MKGQNSKRSRGHRGNGRRAGFHGRGSTFESNGPEGKIRGTAFQVIEKYQSLARDALTAGDRIGAENFFQHAEHYHRVVAANGWDQRDQQRGQRGQGQGQGQNQPQGQQQAQPPQREEQPANGSDPNEAPETKAAAEESPAEEIASPAS